MTLVKSFFYDTEPFMLPTNTILVHNVGNWGLYHNYIEGWTLIVTRGKLGGSPGWRVRQIGGIMNIKHAESFVETHCGACLGLY